MFNLTALSKNINLSIFVVLVSQGGVSNSHIWTSINEHGMSDFLVDLLSYKSKCLCHDLIFYMEIKSPTHYWHDIACKIVLLALLLFCFNWVCKMQRM